MVGVHTWIKYLTIWIYVKILQMFVHILYSLRNNFISPP